MHKAVVGDAHKLPKVQNAAISGCDLIHKLFWCNACIFCLVFDFLSMFIRTGYEQHVVALEVLIPGHGICGDGAVGVSDMMQNLYEDKCAGTIPQTVFQTLMHKCEAEQAEKFEAIPELERKVKSYLENRTDANRWLTIIRQYTEIAELDESILFELVDRIEVGETQKVGGQRICDLRVYYRYVGNVDAALALEERRQPLEEAI